jgi:tripartite-type tricarboxylate transporter receptor subunit TctC
VPEEAQEKEIKEVEIGTRAYGGPGPNIIKKNSRTGGSEMNKLITRVTLGAALVASSALGAASGARADAISDFYKTKDVRLIIGANVGGSYDVHGRTVARHIGRHIPGTPRIVVQNKQGAGSQITAGYVYNVAPQDGTVMAALLNTLPIRQAVGRTRKTFDVNKLQWIGNITNDVTVLTVWNASTKARTVEDARKMDIIIGGTSPTGLSNLIPKAMNYALDTRFKVVSGYKGGLGVDQALEKGEVAARAGANWSVVKAVHPHWVKNNKLSVMVQIGGHKAKDLQHVPLLHELARNDEERLILEFFSIPMDVGKPIAAGPKVPADKIRVLRAAFDLMVKDPKFLADANRQGLVISPVKGADLQKLVAKIVNSPKHTIDAAKKIFGKKKKRKKKKKKKAS